LRMNRRLSSSAIVFLLLTGLLVSLVNIDANQTVKVAGQQAEPPMFEGDVPVRGTYVLADNDVVEWDDNGDGVKEQHHLEAPLIVDLAAAGFKPGDTILINGRSKIYYAADSDRSLFHSGPNTLWGVFSSSSTILWQSQDGEIGPLNRVPGAISAGEPFESTPTYNDGHSTDIPEDFYVNASAPIGTSVKIPPGAAYLIFSGSSSKFTDNDGWTKVTIEKDSDGDGLWDSWETKGIDADKDGAIDLKLEGANWQQKDIYVEVDYMQGHKPNQAALDDVVAAFRNCPDTVENGPITLHVEVDTTTVCPHYDYLRFDDAKDFKSKAGFGTYAQQQSDNSKAILEAKRYAYHYCLFAHSIEVLNKTVFTNTTAGGIAECPGNDFVVSLGAWTGGVGSRDEQAGTFMHELGHNLGLNHGGGDKVNYKPNYLSVMNYQFHTSKTLRNRPLTYSSAKLRTLTESGLDETTGLNGANWDWTVYSGVLKANNVTKYVPLAVSTLGAIDWNNDGDEDDAYTQANINNFPQRDYANTDDEILYGFDDWTNLNFYFTESAAFASGMESWDISDIEMTWEVAQAMEEDAKNMVGGPTGPVQVLDVDIRVQPSPQEQNSASPIDTIILVIVAVVVIVAVAAVALLVLWKRKKQPAP
jgi:hypothetical protein